tara:strand:- start:45327 stop:45959 length:633 start_codon:yes stop_codon:yes gene_type:complete
LDAIKKFYDVHLLPYVLICACTNKSAKKQREIVVPKAEGTVLEIGFGSGLNIAFYDPIKIKKLWALDPTEKLLNLAKSKIANSRFPIQTLNCFAEKIPLPDNSIDTALMTYTMCSITEPLKANKEIKRVLRPNGKLIFCEHGISTNEKDARWQKKLNPYWEKIAGGCQLTRNIPKIIESSDFKIIELEHRHLKGTPKFAGYNYWGEAVPN